MPASGSSTVIEHGEEVERHFTTEEIDGFLLLMARYGGSARRVHEVLKSSGLEIPHATLQYWKTTTFAERYLELASGLSRKEAEQGIEQAYRESIVELQDIGQGLRERLGNELERLDTKDLPKALRDVTLAGAVNTDKYLLLQERPTVITESKNPDWYEQKLRELAEDLRNTVNGTAEEETPQVEAEGATAPEVPGGLATQRAPHRQTRTDTGLS